MDDICEKYWGKIKKDRIRNEALKQKLESKICYRIRREVAAMA